MTTETETEPKEPEVTTITVQPLTPILTQIAQRIRVLRLISFTDLFDEACDHYENYQAGPGDDRDTIINDILIKEFTAQDLDAYRREQVAVSKDYDNG